MIIHYDLFAGIGGFSYALDKVFYDEEIKHIFCEWETFPTAILEKHWPEGVFYGDIADLVADTKRQRRERSSGENKRRYGLSDRETTDKNKTILTGGFPCQPFSHAGRRKGTADDRYKWPEMFAVIRNVQPDWIIAENVRGLASWNDGMVLETVCTDLENEGYEVRPYVIPAASVGAPHRRERVWIVANRCCERRQQKPRSAPSDESANEGWSSQDNNELAGKSEVTTPNPRPQRRQERSDQDIRPESKVTERQDNGFSRSEWDRDWQEVAIATCHDGVDDGVSYRMDGVTISAARHRKERLKACGNAIVPQVAIEILSAIRETMQ